MLFASGVAGALALGALTAWLSGRGAEAWFRHAALYLQMVGLVVLVLELTRTRVLFSQRTFLVVVRDYASNVWAARLPPRAVRIEARAAFTTTVASDAKLVATAIVSDHDVQGRLKRLETLVAHQGKEIGERIESVSRHVASVDRDTRERLSTVSRANEALREQTSTAVIRDLGNESVSLLWLLFGATLSAIPAELAWLLEWALR
jgi:hypothetical protein